jgi:hypothetical protein
LIIGIADGSEYPWLKSRADQEESANQAKDEGLEYENRESIQSAMDDLRESYPRSSLHSLMMFDSTVQGPHPHLPPETIFVPPVTQLKATTMKTLMCDLTSTLLAELTTLARSIQALPMVPSPASQVGLSDSVPSWAGIDLSGQNSRRNSQVPLSTRPVSPITTPQKDLHRMSMPVLPSASGGALSVEEAGATSPTEQGAHTPPTTFDEISGVNATNALHRTSSGPAKPNGATRDPSADRMSIHGFGSGGIGERARNKVRGRVSVIVGSLYLSAGQWSEALKELTEGATRAKALSDHLWHAKALENIMVCLLLYAWSGFDFHVSVLLDSLKLA